MSELCFKCNIHVYFALTSIKNRSKIKADKLNKEVIRNDAEVLLHD